MTSALSLDDRLELADLAARYAVAVDTRAFELLHDVFVADCQLDTGRSVREGIDQVVEAMEGLRRYEVTTHILGQQLVEPDGEDVQSLTYCTAHHLSKPDENGAQTDMVMHVRYHDRSVRTPNGWRIATRRLQVLWRDEKPIS